MESDITLAMAEDHLLLRQSVVNTLDRYNEFRMLFDVGNGQELLERLKLQVPDVILLDIEMPVMNGKQALERIACEFPEVKVIILSQHFDLLHVREFLKLGAHSYLPKNAGFDEMIEAIRVVHRKGIYYSRRIKQLLGKQLQPGAYNAILENKAIFTQREIEVLDLLRQNKTNAQISAILGINTRTVEGHRSSLLQKAECTNLAALVTYALEHHIIPVTAILATS